MTVIQLVRRPNNSETVSILRCLLDKAIDGQVIGIAMCFTMSNGTEEAVFTGPYGSDPTGGASSALKISLRLMRQAEGL